MLLPVGLVLGALILRPVVASAELIPTGPELRLSGNRPVLGIDNQPAIAADAGGNFVVVWRSLTNQGRRVGIRGRRFAESGTPLGPDFTVSSATLTLHNYPDVAMDAAGNFVVVWAADDGDSHGIFARRYDAAGIPLSGGFQVNTYTTGFQGGALVARAATGEFIVAWSDPRNRYDVFARHYDAAGAAARGEFQVNTYTTGEQGLAAVVADPSGHFVIVWNRHDGSGVPLSGRRYNADGSPQGEEFNVAAYTTGSRQATSVAPTADGSFVVAFAGSADVPQIPQVFARRFDATGVPLGPEFQLNQRTADFSAPRIATDGSGNFLATWTLHDDGSSIGVAGRLLDATGAPVSGEFTVNTYTSDGQYDAQVAPLSNGDFVVVWATYEQFASNPAGGIEIMGQRFTSTCGDGALQPGEACDDGGNAAGDGCSAACVLEACWTCTGAPSTCAPIAICAEGDGCCPTGCDAPADDDCPARVTGLRLELSETPGNSEFEPLRRLTFVSADPAVDATRATGIDPATDGASLHVYNPATGESACFELEPAPGATWTTSGPRRTLAYQDRRHVNGACRAARIVNRKRLKVVCGEPTGRLPFQYSLYEPSQGSIAVRFRSGSTEYCTVFGGTVTADAPLRFSARDAPPPAACPAPPAPCP